VNYLSEWLSEKADQKQKSAMIEYETIGEQIKKLVEESAQKDKVIVIDFSGKNNVKAPSIALPMWVNGKIMRGYIYAPRRAKRKLGENEYLGRVKVGNHNVWGRVAVDSQSKLYFVPSQDCQYKHLV
jgi:hypothetical protein